MPKNKINSGINSIPDFDRNYTGAVNKVAHAKRELQRAKEMLESGAEGSTDRHNRAQFQYQVAVETAIARTLTATAAPFGKTARAFRSELRPNSRFYASFHRNDTRVRRLIGQANGQQRSLKPRPDYPGEVWGLNNARVIITMIDGDVAVEFFNSHEAYVKAANEVLLGCWEYAMAS